MKPHELPRPKPVPSPDRAVVIRAVLEAIQQAADDVYEFRLSGALAALREIHEQQGKVCDTYEMCDHRACESSYSAWAIADAALREIAPSSEKEGPA